MFSNKLIRSIATASNEEGLALSPADHQLVLDANRNFTESPEDWRGSAAWGRYLLAKVQGEKEPLVFSKSLELCCGNGFVFFSFLELFGDMSGSRHIDLADRQCEAFRQRCREVEILVPEIIQGDINHLPFEDSSLNLVYGHSFLHHLPDVGCVAREVARVLAVGGRFVAFHEPTPTAPFLESFPRSLFRDVDIGSLTDIWVIKPDVIERILLRAGFSDVRVYPSNLFACLFVTPWQILFSKFGISCTGNLVATIRLWCDHVDRLLPRALALRIAPSLAVVAIK